MRPTMGLAHIIIMGPAMWRRPVRCLRPIMAVTEPQHFMNW